MSVGLYIVVPMKNRELPFQSRLFPRFFAAILGYNVYSVSTGYITFHPKPDISVKLPIFLRDLKR